MPIQVRRTWQDKIASVSFVFEGDSATIDYYINRITPALVRRVTASNDIEVLTTALSELIARWDVLGEPPLTEPGIVQAMMGAGPESAPPPPAPPTMYPTTPAALVQLPMPFLTAVTEAIFGSIAPKSQQTARR